MKKIILLLAFSNIAFTQNIKSTKDVEKVLDKLHLYAAEANAKKYFSESFTYSPSSSWMCKVTKMKNLKKWRD